MTIKDPSEILITTAEILGENGRDGFSLSVLAAKLGITKATLYHYWSSKEALIEAMHDHYHDRLLKKGYKLSMKDSLLKCLDELIRHWEEIFLSDEFYWYLRSLLSERLTDERAAEEWHSLELMISSQSQVVFDSFNMRERIKGAHIAHVLFSSLLELKLEKALISGESEDLEELGSEFMSFVD